MIDLFSKYSDRLEKEALREKVGMIKDDSLESFLKVCVEKAEEAEEDARIYRRLEELARERLGNGGKNEKRNRG